MDRRIRVKCPKCAAPIELRVDQQELLDVTCPRCENLFTAIVPPQIVEVTPVEVFEVIEEAPQERKTRVVQPAVPSESQRTPSRPKRIRQVSPPSSTAIPNTSWQAPMPTYQAAPRVSAGTHLKAVLIASGSVLGLGLLILVGVLIRSALSNLSWPTSSDDGASSQLASNSLATSTDSVSSSQVPSNDPQSSPVPSSPVSSSPGESINPTNSNSQSSNTDSSLKPPSTDVTEKVITLAEQIAQATKEMENEFVIDRTYPKLIEFAGGRNKLLEILNKALEPMKSQGITIADYKISRDVKIRNAGRNIFVVVPTVLDLNYQGRITRTDSFLLAISEDAGRTFTFLDGSGAAKNRSMLKRLLPNLPDDFEIPTPGLPRQISP